MIFTCTELLETRRQIVNIIFKSIIIKVSVSELVNKWVKEREREERERESKREREKERGRYCVRASADHSWASHIIVRIGQ